MSKVVGGGLAECTFGPFGEEIVVAEELENLVQMGEGSFQCWVVNKNIIEKKQRYTCEVMAGESSS